jgi:hypothetical protein
LLDSEIDERVEDIIQVAMEEFSILRALWLYISDYGDWSIDKGALKYAYRFLSI